MNFDQLFEKFSSIKAGVVGDIMLDTYWWGHVDRISPEAPVPVVALDKREVRIGGAGNVALNLASLGTKTSFFSVIGDDDNGKELSELLVKAGIDTSFIIKNAARKTTNKTRVICRNQQMMRLDAETTNDLQSELENALLDNIKKYIAREKPQVIILEDYNKGVLTEKVITEIIAACKANGVITTVDPKRKNFFAYKGVNIFKPNLKEVKEGLNLLINEVNLQALNHIHDLLQQQLGHDTSLITLSEKGVFYNNKNDANIIASHVRNIADVSGAGDTVIAVASLVYAATQDTRLMAAVANIAGGLVCEEVGTAAIDRHLLLAECKKLLASELQ
jgi:D-glycero-beta-D-manno-heptose-7-phosphate kinase